jgi:protein TonB
MQVKKNPEKDVRNKRFDFTLIGLTVALAIILGAFEYTTPPEKKMVLEGPDIDEDLVVMENTVQEKKPPPPPPPPTLEVVEDEVELEEQPEFEETETDQDEAMEVYEEEEEEPEETNEIFEMFAVQEPATFPGGEDELRRFLKENISYPDAALQAEVQGTVVIRFVVDKYGNVSNLEVLTPPKGFGLETEAKRVLKLTSGKWKPAKQRDQPVSVRYQIPVNFQMY